MAAAARVTFILSLVHLLCALGLLSCDAYDVVNPLYTCCVSDHASSSITGFIPPLLLLSVQSRIPNIIASARVCHGHPRRTMISIARRYHQEI